MKEGIDVVLDFQRNEITEAKVYGFLSKLAKGKNKEILNKSEMTNLSTTKCGVKSAVKM